MTKPTGRRSPNRGTDHVDGPAHWTPQWWSPQRLMRCFLAGRFKRRKKASIHHALFAARADHSRVLDIPLLPKPVEAIRSEGHNTLDRLDLRPVGLRGGQLSTISTQPQHPPKKPPSG